MANISMATGYISIETDNKDDMLILLKTLNELNSKSRYKTYIDHIEETIPLVEEKNMTFLKILLVLKVDGHIIII